MFVVTVPPPGVWAVWVLAPDGAGPGGGGEAAGPGPAAGWAGAAACCDGAAAGAVVMVVAGAAVVVVVGAGVFAPPRRAAAAGLGRTSSRATAPVGRRVISHGTRLPRLFKPIPAAAASAQPVHI